MYVCIIIIIITSITPNNSESLLQCGNYAHSNVIKEIFCEEIILRAFVLDCDAEGLLSWETM